MTVETTPSADTTEPCFMIHELCRIALTPTTYHRFMLRAISADWLQHFLHYNLATIHKTLRSP
jgi:hypothetical protein